MDTTPTALRQSVHYEDGVVRALVTFAIAWALIGMSAGVYAAAELVWPSLDLGHPWLTFGRMRTFHTNVVVFGFGVSALIGTAFYSVQRTCHVRLFSPTLAWIVCYGWQIGILAGGLRCLPDTIRARNTPSSSGPLTLRSPSFGWRSPSCSSAPSRYARSGRSISPTGSTGR